MPRNRLLKKLSMGKADLNQSLTNEPQRIICFSGRNDSHRMALCRSGSGFALKEDGMQIDIQSRDFTLTESHFQGRGLRFKVRLSDVNGPTGGGGTMAATATTNAGSSNASHSFAICSIDAH